MAHLDYNEELINIRTQNKKEMHNIEELLFFLEKNLKDGSIKAETNEAKLVLENITKYIGNNYKKIQAEEEQYDKELMEKAENEMPKSFI